MRERERGERDAIPISSSRIDNSPHPASPKYWMPPFSGHPKGADYSTRGLLGGSSRGVSLWGKGFIHSSQEGQWKAGKHHGRGPQWFANWGWSKKKVVALTADRLISGLTLEWQAYLLGIFHFTNLWSDLESSFKLCFPHYPPSIFVQLSRSF